MKLVPLEDRIVVRTAEVLPGSEEMGDRVMVFGESRPRAIIGVQLEHGGKNGLTELQSIAQRADVLA